MEILSKRERSVLYFFLGITTSLTILLFVRSMTHDCKCKECPSCISSQIPISQAIELLPAQLSIPSQPSQSYQFSPFQQDVKIDRYKDASINSPYSIIETFDNEGYMFAR
jgi:hypothetical protein